MSNTISTRFGINNLFGMFGGGGDLAADLLSGDPNRLRSALAQLQQMPEAKLASFVGGLAPDARSALFNASGGGQQRQTTLPTADNFTGPNQRPDVADRIWYGGYIPGVGRTDQDISAIKLKEHLKKQLGMGDKMTDTAAKTMFDGMLGQLAQRTAGIGGVPWGIATLPMKTWDMAMASASNDAFRGGLGDYQKWRQQNPNATQSQIYDYVQSQLAPGHAPNDLAAFSSTLNAGKAGLSPEDWKRFMAMKPAMIAAMLEQTYGEMNKLYPEGWTMKK